VAPSKAEAPKGPDPEDVARQEAKQEHLKREFRICLREIIAELRKTRRYSYFWNPGESQSPVSLGVGGFGHVPVPVG
jgi:hypothetical protein